MIAYILFDNNFYKEVIIDKTILEYLLDDLSEIGIKNIVGVKYGFDVKHDRIKKYIDYKDLVLSEGNNESLLISSNVFFQDIEKFKRIIYKTMQKHKKNLIISNNYSNKYHNNYGILKKEGRIIYKKTLNDLYFVNDYKTLSFLEDELRKRINTSLMRNGVIINNTDSVTVSKDAIISKGSVIKQGSIILGKSIIGENCIIGPYSYIKDSKIEEGTSCSYSVVEDCLVKKKVSVGPFARLRMNSIIGESNRVGNFVEVKNSTIGDKTNVAHLAYLGDTVCGNEVNFGCGSITVNYDGKNKHKTLIGDKVFIGCNSNLIAPIKIKSKSFIAAGSTITEDVKEGSFVIARTKQVTKLDYAKKYKFKEEGVKSMLKVIKCKDYEEASKVASEIFINAIKENPQITLGLATGSTPIGTYKNLIKAYQNKEISFKNVKSYNLDEYVGLPLEHPETYYNFMHTNLFNHVDMLEENVHVPHAEKENMEESCKKYSDMLNATTVDIQLLGIGANGHIGFNEPGTSFDQETFIVELTQKTREDNKRFFNSIDEVPTHAITMGIKNIMNAKKVVLVATGANKQEAVKKLLSNEITTSFPASALHMHKDVVVIIDEEAGKLL